MFEVIPKRKKEADNSKEKDAANGVNGAPLIPKDRWPGGGKQKENQNGDCDY
jgi:hypothetical protein